MTSMTAQVAETLRAAKHAESMAGVKLTSGFSVFTSGSRPLVVAITGDDVEGHFDSPGRIDMEADLIAGYAETLDAAGWVTTVHAAHNGRSGSLAVSGRKPAEVSA